MDENYFLVKVKDREAATSRILGMDEFYYLVNVGCKLGASREMFSYIHTADEGKFIKFNPVATKIHCMSVYSALR